MIPKLWPNRKTKEKSPQRGLHSLEGFLQLILYTLYVVRSTPLVERP